MSFTVYTYFSFVFCFSEENFYNYLEQFLLSDEQRWENDYPRQHTEDETLVEIKNYTPQVNRECVLLELYQTCLSKDESVEMC